MWLLKLWFRLETDKRKNPQNFNFMNQVFFFFFFLLAISLAIDGLTIKLKTDLVLFHLDKLEFRLEPLNKRGNTPITVIPNAV